MKCYSASMRFRLTSSDYDLFRRKEKEAVMNYMTHDICGDFLRVPMLILESLAPANRQLAKTSEPAVSGEQT